MFIIFFVLKNDVMDGWVLVFMLCIILLGFILLIYLVRSKRFKKVYAFAGLVSLGISCVKGS